MVIERAKSYGFCFGVKRAIKIAEETRNAHTFGPLIHNKQEINRLKQNFNVSLTEDITQFDQNDKVIIRTHGIEKDNLRYLEEKAIDVIDATCPFVTKPQQICEEMSEAGYDIVIFGDKDHPEIKGVRSYAKHGATVVLSVDELKDAHLKERVAVVAQTTRKIENYQAIVNYLMRTHKEVRVFNTICNATFENQDAVRELSVHADVMIVIGGKNSSNTKQLYTISKEQCDASYLVESDDDLDMTWFDNKEHCGISAGASTPDWIIDAIVEKIETFKNN
jgi:4-hydroxy-3-methylbut-2-enyl diphosphate reductase